MQRRKITLMVGALAATALVASACGGGAKSKDEGAQSIGEGTDGAGKTITVWSMDDLSDDTFDAINEEFTAQTGASVNVVVQTWDDIATKITTALASDTPPDVLELGNTMASTFAATGGLMDLTEYKDQLSEGNTWLAGLEDPATIDGQLYAVPTFGASRAAIYNKAVWADAGVTEPPTTYEELLSSLDKVKAANPSEDFSAFYIPGKNWQANMQWVWGTGGEIATQDADGTWVAGFATDESLEGLKDFQEFQNTYSVPASRTVANNEPDQEQLMADGFTTAIIAGSWSLQKLKELNPELTDAELGSFAVPGQKGGTQPVMMAGSVWGIAAKAPNKDLALIWTQIAASEKIAVDYVYGVDGWMPNSIQAGEVAAADPDMPENLRPFFEAALNSKSTPAAAGWAPLEDPGMRDFFATVATGSKDLKQAAEEWDATINKALNE